MGASSMQGFWLSHLFLLQFFLLGVVRESECFLTVEYIMGSDRLNLLQGREDANKILESSSEGLTVKEIGQKITGGRSAYFKHEKHLDKGILQESEDQLDEKFVTPLYTCLMEVDNLDKITEENKNKLKHNIISIQNDINRILSKCFSNSKVETEYGNEFEKTDDEKFHKANSDSEASKLVENLKSAWDILIPSVKDLYSNDFIHQYSIMFSLNDIVLKFLGSDNHKLMIGEEHLKKIFNEEIGAQMVFNYLLGKFPVKKSVTAAYLKFDFKQSLEESPFIDEIMGIHKYLDQDGVNNKGVNSWGFCGISRLHIALQVKSMEDNSFRRLKINHG
ncbi:hypothetical protein PGT21_007067 [Puccinia graminis f. sp. tritici]|uniref:Uncharacterized protein n=1 Tax=Puccinia graminis f. sp. tritici TaxID=56615 RepID=A0A5B0LTV2_PUCGR|nr:hypothetical protein PGT21_007067 [Puccinia graminis f. sp. tritici]